MERQLREVIGTIDKWLRQREPHPTRDGPNDEEAPNNACGSPI
jgi:hypothetical protein